MTDLISLYKRYYNPAKRELRKVGCSSFIFEDLYQESFFILMRMKKEQGKSLDHPYTYIIRICKSLWIEECKRQEIHETADDLDGFQYQETETNEDKLQLVQSYHKKLSPACQELLTLYYEGYSEDEICARLGFGNRRVVSNKKRYCKERLRKMINNDPKFKELNG